MRKLFISMSMLAVLVGCGTVAQTAQLPAPSPQVITQVVTRVVTQVVTATPKPATPTPKATATPAMTPTPEATAMPVTGKWTNDTSVSSFDDSKTVVLSVAAEEDITGSFGVTRPTLYVRCEEHVKEVYIHTGSQADVESGNLDGATVRIRFDSEATLTENASKSTSGMSLFLDGSQKYIDLMTAHERMVFEFTPFNSSPAEMTFDLRGLSEAIKPLNDACP